ncbi:MAG: sugar-binding domain-containing protein, partial [Candidatus Jordarchaeaceae archaeon]
MKKQEGPSDLLVEVSKYYYEEQLTQAQIAKKFGLSRPKISRLLKLARETGLVKVIISNPFEDLHSLEKKLTSLFALKDVKVVFVPEANDTLSKQITARESVSFIWRLFEPGDRIGVGWGVTIYEVVKNLPSSRLEGATIVQLSGGVDNAKTKNYANEIVQTLAQKLEAEAFTLPCPAMVDSKAIAEALMSDAKIKRVLELGRNCNKMVISIGVPGEDSCLTQAGYIKPEDLQRLQKEDAVGIMCNRFYNSKGEICDIDLDQRTLGIRLEDIKDADCVI